MDIEAAATNGPGDAPNLAARRRRPTRSASPVTWPVTWPVAFPRTL